MVVWKRRETLFSDLDRLDQAYRDHATKLRNRYSERQTEVHFGSRFFLIPWENIDDAILQRDNWVRLMAETD